MNVLDLAFVLQEHAEGAAPPTPFTLNPGLIIWTWLVFGALFLMLRQFVWPSIVNLAEEREKTIQRQLEEAEKMNDDARTTLEEHKRLLAGAREEAAQLVAEAKTVAEKERENLVAKARQEQEQILDRAKREIEVERERALADLRREAVDLSLAAASRLVGSTLDSDANRKIVVDYLDSIGEQS